MIPLAIVTIIGLILAWGCLHRAQALLKKVTALCAESSAETQSANASLEHAERMLLTAQGLTQLKTIANRMHDAADLQGHVESLISDELQEHETLEDLDFTISNDYYDNSLTVRFTVHIERPWEPCLASRQAIYDLGFSIVFWEFTDGTEIRGTEPRRTRMNKPEKLPSGIWTLGHRLVEGVGYVDDLWTEAWIGGPHDCRGKIVHPSEQTEPT